MDRAELGPGQAGSAELELDRRAAGGQLPRDSGDPSPEDDGPPADRGGRRRRSQMDSAADAEAVRTARRSGGRAAAVEDREHFAAGARVESNREPARAVRDGRRSPARFNGTGVEALDDRHGPAFERSVGAHRQAAAVRHAHSAADDQSPWPLLVIPAEAGR